MSRAAFGALALVAMALSGVIALQLPGKEDDEVTSGAAAAAVARGAPRPRYRPRPRPTAPANGRRRR